MQEQFMEESENDRKTLEDTIFHQLDEIYDPEIMAPITQLGLIYRVEVKEESIIEVDFTLTYPGCPWGPDLERMIQGRLRKLNPWAEKVRTLQVYDPPWQINFASEELRVAMGYPI